MSNNANISVLDKIRLIQHTNTCERLSLVERAVLIKLITDKAEYNTATALLAKQLSVARSTVTIAVKSLIEKELIYKRGSYKSEFGVKKYNTICIRNLRAFLNLKDKTSKSKKQRIEIYNNIATQLKDVVAVSDVEYLLRTEEAGQFFEEHAEGRTATEIFNTKDIIITKLKRNINNLKSKQEIKNG
jgi:predicted transcriptional regulator